MDQTLRTYDPSLVLVAVGPMTLAGFADGTFVKITRSGDAFEKKKGADGTVDRINKCAYDFEAEFTLKRTNPLNAKLSALLAADQKSNDGVFPLTIRDKSGNSLFEAPQAWIKKDPDVEYADSLGGYTWKIDTAAGANLIGGN
jgi:hypothetical protein